MRNLFETLTVKDKIAVYREVGGLGDILMHRMIFEDMKLIWPEVKITFACPKRYHEAVADHPFIDQVIDSKEINHKEYLTVYDTSRSCYQTEMVQAPQVKDHRSDIWAKTCGLTLSRHEMHIKLTSEEISKVKKIIPSKHYALIAPITAMNSKNLEVNQIKNVEKHLEKMGLDVFYLHDKELPEFGKTIHGIGIRDMVAAINGSSLIVAADTAAFHMAGGMKKPVVGVFGWADGKIYGKYYPQCQIVQKHREDDPNWTCGPCFKFYCCPKCDLKIVRKPCITEINSDMIIEGIERLTKKTLSLPVHNDKY